MARNLPAGRHGRTRSRIGNQPIFCSAIGADDLFWNFQSDMRMVVRRRLARADDCIRVNANFIKPPIIIHFRRLGFHWHDRSALPPGQPMPAYRANIAPAGGLQASRAIKRQDKATSHAASLRDSRDRRRLPCGCGGGSSSFTPLNLSSAIRASMIEENVTGKGVPGR